MLGKHLSWQDTCVDSTMKILAGGLPPNLRELRLSFEGCNRLTDASLSSLGNLGCSMLQRFAFTACFV